MAAYRQDSAPSQLIIIARNLGPFFKRTELIPLYPYFHLFDDHCKGPTVPSSAIPFVYLHTSLAVFHLSIISDIQVGQSADKDHGSHSSHPQPVHLHSPEAILHMRL